MWKGFKQFILRGNAIELAIGVVIGASFSQVVNALVKGFINPLIGLIGGEPNFHWVITVGKSKFLVGDFLTALITFLINASVIYFLVINPMQHLMQRVNKEKPQDPSEKKCSECMSLIPTNAKKCKFCASVQPAQKSK